jgi:hypothetical protein
LREARRTRETIGKCALSDGIDTVGSRLFAAVLSMTS